MRVRNDDMNDEMMLMSYSYHDHKLYSFSQHSDSVSVSEATTKSLS